MRPVFLRDRLRQTARKRQNARFAAEGVFFLTLRSFLCDFLRFKPPRLRLLLRTPASACKSSSVAFSAAVQALAGWGLVGA